jgi:hypothetical protein
VELAIKQFEGSPWNHDLYQPTDEARTNLFFRFEDKDGFKPLPIKAKNWTDLCEKRSVAQTAKVVL